jgi:elongation factor P hydroxylase
LGELRYAKHFHDSKIDQRKGNRQDKKPKIFKIFDTSKEEQFMHHHEDIIKIFNNCFLEAYNTELVKGEDEPIYLPVNKDRPHNQVIFAHGFFASALHECSHWLIAGKKRREEVDFGYWYVPDGRSNEEQELFQSVEVKPQALEWILAYACNYRFYISVDNLSGAPFDAMRFKKSVHSQVGKYCLEGLPLRAKIFREALCSFYGTSTILRFEDFDFQAII